MEVSETVDSRLIQVFLLLGVLLILPHGFKKGYLIRVEQGGRTDPEDAHGPDHGADRARWGGGRGENGEKKPYI